MAPSHSVKVIDRVQVSPPPGSVPTTSLPLTFFDFPWLLCPPMERLFFYELPYPTLYFMHNILPSLKNSLSLALQYFFPLASNLMCPLSPHKPYILFNDGDSIPFTMVESTMNFDQIIGDQAGDPTELHAFVPKWPPTRVTSDGKRVAPLLALQVVVFPNSGICIGAKFCHVVADGMAFNHFMKSWASIFRSRENMACLEKSVLPSHDRSGIKDPFELDSIFSKEWWSWASSRDYNLGSNHDDQLRDKVRVTFTIGQTHIERLKDLVSIQCMKNYQGQVHVSTFVVACAFIWVNMIKSQEKEASDLFDNDKVCYFVFVADCRHRLEVKLPSTYFGNCLAICYVPAKKSELLGENGIIMAARAIGKKVKELESGVLVGAEKWISKWKEVSEQGRLVTVAGSPKLRAYETDFGWGRPKKTEVLHIYASGGFHLCECRDGGGGLEVGLALPQVQMDVFCGIFEQSKRNLI
ncbi:PREDICTED: coumaroyl-CoA:anthocyanidin 3-O-glucoside-6''-O-coumaroyltransferase 1-like [Populus euphratica]|uniref:Coumaroyl-CoA:anthocyanidin 3-O-glucoside-6''-O-coumaroyltransferase 1-like n=1 Tax=Populus euphratica TaxID=75702 RepID=A0AAJ6VH54_POPEU|nr:PREDICTED: coumaroyl-CoA:anthocyanidin 3-O-glucoside-6''-O-coumaroyltransferase 1-like [Populus euphratica]